MPALISGDEQAQISVSYGATQVVVDHVDADGIWRKSKEHQRVQVTRLEGAFLAADLWQLGFSFPMMTREYGSEKYTGFGDVSTTLSYEYLPDWNYNPYRPKGIGFVQVRLPLGRSRAESELGGLDSMGSGFWALGVGTMLVKSWSRWDLYGFFEIHRSFEKRVSNIMIQGRLLPGNGGTGELGMGYNWQKLRTGVSVSESFEDPLNIDSITSVTNGQTERYAVLAISLSYLLDDEWSGAFTINDQTLIGAPANTSLGRGASIQILRRWTR